MSTTSSPNGHEMPRVHYLNASYGIRSWLLTTDHKRIAMLYLAADASKFMTGEVLRPNGGVHMP